MKTKNKIYPLLLTTLLFGLNGTAFAETVDKIIAKVGSDVITQSELQGNLELKKVSFQEKFGDQEGAGRFASFRKNALNEMVLQKILENEVKNEKISVSSQEIEQEYQDRVRRTRLSEPEFVSRLAQKGLSLAEYKSEIKRDIEQRRFIEKKIMPGITISDYDIQKEYEKNKNSYITYKKFRFIEVFLTPDGFTNADQLMETAKQIRQNLAAGRNPAEQIKKLSSGAYRDKGGDSGLIDAATLRPEIRDVLSMLKVGETSQLFPVGNGVYMVKLTARAEPEPLPLGTVSGMIRGKIAEKTVQSELRQYLMAVKDQTFVEILK